MPFGFDAPGVKTLGFVCNRRYTSLTPSIRIRKSNGERISVVNWHVKNAVYMTQLSQSQLCKKCKYNADSFCMIPCVVIQAVYSFYSWESPKFRTQKLFSFCSCVAYTVHNLPPYKMTFNTQVLYTVVFIFSYS